MNNGNHAPPPSYPQELGLPELGAAGRSGLAGLLKEQRATVAQLGKQAGAMAKALAALA